MQEGKRILNEGMSKKLQITPRLLTVERSVQKLG